ncbi:hypothetical protein RchiOBHm_Chr6g0268241 [Rosa chinensis]|uniref:Secreted protein n=1 Tax=Rosa chinensis TaxID=74649 RepID=A0A2P6PQ59_ROSCH|nr:hypothetical protein RchiOBHm_Chr6g0268241 [Rosa chinensis]
MVRLSLVLISTSSFLNASMVARTSSAILSTVTWSVSRASLISPICSFGTGVSSSFLSLPLPRALHFSRATTRSFRLFTSIIRAANSSRSTRSNTLVISINLSGTPASSPSCWSYQSNLCWFVILPVIVVSFLSRVGSDTNCHGPNFAMRKADRVALASKQVSQVSTLQGTMKATRY